MTFKEYRKNGFNGHLTPVHINKMRCDKFYWDWSSDLGDWVQGKEVPEKLKRMYDTPYWSKRTNKISL